MRKIRPVKIAPVWLEVGDTLVDGDDCTILGCVVEIQGVGEGGLWRARFRTPEGETKRIVLSNPDRPSIWIGVPSNRGGHSVKWIKSSRSNGSGGSNCVEVARADNGDYVIRNSKDPKGAVLVFTPAEWYAFTTGVKDGQFNF